jgi:outer membrane protein TolC
MNLSTNFRVMALLTLLLISAGCAVGPNYKRPAAVAPPAFKEQPPVNFKEAEAAGWKQSQPGDAYSKGRWWELYNDAALNALEEQVNVSNQNVLQAEAQYREAKAAVSVARAALSPTVTTAPAATFAGGAATTSTAAAPASRKSFTLPINVSWEPDLWGNIRRGVTASAATAQSLAANVGNARLLYQAELAQDYFGLHGNDGEAGFRRCRVGPRRCRGRDATVRRAGSIDGSRRGARGV